MKPFDLLLVSLAVGLTLYTAHVLGGTGAGAAAAVEPASGKPAFRWIILHHGAGHGRPENAPRRHHRIRLEDLAFHFLLGNGHGSPDGEVETGYRWRDQVPGPHTGTPDVDRESIGICLEGDLEATPPTRRQVVALMALLERLCREYAIPPEHVRSHREVVAGADCPGKGLPAAEIRAALARRLKPPLPQGCP